MTPSKELRALGLPSPTSVRTDRRGRPTSVDGRRVIQTREVWRIEDEWWRSPIDRLYYEVVLENGRRIVLHRDLVKGGWYES